MRFSYTDEGGWERYYSEQITSSQEKVNKQQTYESFVAEVETSNQSGLHEFRVFIQFYLEKNASPPPMLYNNIS